MKTFPIKTSKGIVQAEQLGTFTHYIKNVQFRFVVTRMPRSSNVMVTHRHSTASVCQIPANTILACLRDYVGAGKLELDRLIASKGADRVYDVLRRAEKE